MKNIVTILFRASFFCCLLVSCQSGRRLDMSGENHLANGREDFTIVVNLQSMNVVDFTAYVAGASMKPADIQVNELVAGMGSLFIVKVHYQSASAVMIRQISNELYRWPGVVEVQVSRF